MKVVFMPGIASISGAMKSKHGKTVVFAHCQSDKPGQGRCYIRDAEYKRSKPLTPGEQAARTRFHAVTQQLNAMSDEDKQRYAKEMHDARSRFNGKKYNSLRGYIMARLYAQQ